MSSSPKLLDEAFKNALSKASTLDQQGIIPEHTEEMYPDGPPTHVQLVQECLDLYNQHYVVMDRAIQGARNLLSTPEGVAQVKALEASFETGANDSRSIQLASEMLSGRQFGLRNAADIEEVVGVGIGVSAGLSAIVGILGGVDIVSDFQNKAQVIPRAWGGFSFKGGISFSYGLEVSFWVNTPISGPIGGTILDLSDPPHFLRIMHIKQYLSGNKSGTSSALSFQFPYGDGLPVRNPHEPYPGVASVFGGAQIAESRSRRSTFSVINKVTGQDSIQVKENTTLVGTLKNTSGNNISLSAGATMTIGMPSYFASTDVSRMGVALPGWTVAINGNNITLTLSAAYTWQAGASISINITNVQCSNFPPGDEPSIPGVVSLNLSDPSFIPIVNTADFDLAWPPLNLSLVFKVALSPQPDYTLTGPSYGTPSITGAMPSSDVMQLTTATQISTGDNWVLGYLFNYTSTLSAEVAAAWFNTVTKQTLTGLWITISGGTSFCYNTDGSSISVTVNFG